MIPDDELRARLARRAEAARPRDAAGLARAATAGRRPTSGPTPRVIGGVSVAATIAIAIALGGGLLLRGTPVASPSAAEVPSGTVPATAPGPTPWARITWTAGDLGPFNRAGYIGVTDGLWDGSGFLAIGTQEEYGDTKTWTGHVFGSSDGATWEGSELRDVLLNRVLPVGGGYVLLGSRLPPVEGELQDFDPALTVWWSADGASWEDRSPDGAASVALRQAASGPAGVVLTIREVGTSDSAGLLLADPDLNWTRVPDPWSDDVRIRGIVSGPDGWIAFGAQGVVDGAGSPTGAAVWTSPDGRVWSLADIEEPGGQITGMVPVGDGFLAYGFDGGFCEACFTDFVDRRSVPTWFSSDGRTWSREAVLNTGLKVDKLRIASDGERALAFAADAAAELSIKESLDGVTWHDVEVLYGVAAGGLLEDRAHWWIQGTVVVGPDRLLSVHERYTGETVLMVPAVGIPTGQDPGADVTSPSSIE